MSTTAAVNTTTNAHLDRAKTALRQYIRSGGGFVGIHNAFGTEYNWKWYEGLLGDANYFDHGANQDGLVKIVAQDSSTSGISNFDFRDEWYNFEPFPSTVKFLATVDENSLATRRTVHPGHGDFHPVAWCQYYDGGRSWVTSLGHDGRGLHRWFRIPRSAAVQEVDRQRDSFGDGQHSFLSIKKSPWPQPCGLFRERGSRLGLALFTSTALERVSTWLETNQPAVARAWPRLEVEPGFFVDALASEPIAFRPFNHVAKAGTSGSPPSVRVSA